MSNVRLVGALDDEHGRTVAVYQDHDGIRIDTAIIEILFSRAGAGRLIGLLEAADADAGSYAADARDMAMGAGVGTMTDAKRLEIIGYLLDAHERAVNDDDGDKHLAQPGYLLEAISAAVAGDRDNPILRMFLAGSDA